MDKNETLVLKAMKKAAKPVKAGEIAEMTGLDKNETTKVIKKLQGEGKITSPKKCFYLTS
ncbi:MAG TPA: MarR family transcriptional regulator [Spirochaetota bacterium]|nr:MarR family transcriptional regulator [Spirochaetota bacterium]HPI90629.1 MarR family transcriptional regulator [Spirochaetota bacterium]HPR46871.1 MarR family transcriptional regulator [Spirochaetota bacterium]